MSLDYTKQELNVTGGPRQILYKLSLSGIPYAQALQAKWAIEGDDRREIYGKRVQTTLPLRNKPYRVVVSLPDGSELTRWLGDDLKGKLVDSVPGE